MLLQKDNADDVLPCSYFFDYGMSFVGGPIAWRLPVACQMIFAFVSSSLWIRYNGSV